MSNYSSSLSWFCPNVEQNLTHLYLLLLLFFAYFPVGFFHKMIKMILVCVTWHHGHSSDESSQFGEAFSFLYSINQFIYNGDKPLLLITGRSLIFAFFTRQLSLYWLFLTLSNSESDKAFFIRRSLGSFLSLFVSLSLHYFCSLNFIFFIFFS